MHNILSRLFHPGGLLAAVLILGLALSLAGCAGLGLRSGESVQTKAEEDARGQAYYHFLQAQQFLLADDGPGAIREYEEALKDDPNSARLELELASL